MYVWIAGDTASNLSPPTLWSDVENFLAKMFIISGCTNDPCWVYSTHVVLHEASLQRFTMWYDSVYLTCSKKLTGSQLSLPHGINKKKLKREAKNKLRSVIGPVQSRYHEGSLPLLLYLLAKRADLIPHKTGAESGEVLGWGWEYGAPNIGQPPNFWDVVWPSIFLRRQIIVPYW